MNSSRKFYTPTLSRNNKAKSRWLFALLTLALMMSAGLSLFYGATDIDVWEAWRHYRQTGLLNTDGRIFIYARLPRVLAAVLSGSALATSGAILQAVLNNAMASPNIIGVNSGAGLFAILIMAFFPDRHDLIPPAAFLGALLSCLLIYAVGHVSGGRAITVTLSGIALTSVVNAMISTVKILVPESVYNMTTFSVGTLSSVNRTVVGYSAPFILLGLMLAFALSKRIDVLSLGEDTAKSLGMRVSVLRFFLLALAAYLAGLAVAIVGLLGFVGLIVPHLVRRFTGSRHGRLLPVSAFLGAILVLICDLAGRILAKPYEIPVGILLAFLGGIFFMALIIMKRGSVYDHNR